jgi:hypothetical protein
MSLSWPAIFGCAAAVFAFSKLSPGGLKLQLFTSLHAGNIFPHDSYCPTNHPFLVSGFRDNILVLWEAWMLLNTVGSSISKQFLNIKSFFVLHHNAPVRILPSFHNKPVFSWLLVPPFLLRLDSKICSQHVLMDSISSSFVHFSCIFNDFWCLGGPSCQHRFGEET